MERTKRIYALGFFDGVHLGHQALLTECVRLASELGCKTGAITFEKHPQSLFCTRFPPLISTLSDRQRLMKAHGIGEILALPVTPEVMTRPWQAFVQDLLDRDAAGFVCGHDFRFGHRGEGTAQLLAAFCQAHSIPCVIVPEQTLEGNRISSTYIRQQLEAGDMATAVKYLGHPYALTGTVIHGKKLGRTLGIPTANLILPEDLAIPKFGVYACRAIIGDHSFPAVTNIGTRPTVSGFGITVEPWILDFSGDLYGRTITLEFYFFLRPEEKFPNLEALQHQIREDARMTRAYLEEML